MKDNSKRATIASSKDANDQQDPTSGKWGFKFLYNGESVELATLPYSFVDVDHWVRGRFGFSARDSLKYLNGKGLEVIPSHETLTEEDHEVEVIVTIPAEKVRRSSKAGKENQSMIDYGPVVLIGFLAISLAPLAMKDVVDSVVLSTIGLPPDDKHVLRNLLADAYVAFLSWSATYLFIRRYLNPENHGMVLVKYGYDTFYGGLASAAAAIFKHFLSKAMKR